MEKNVRAGVFIEVAGFDKDHLPTIVNLLTERFQVEMACLDLIEGFFCGMHEADEWDDGTLEMELVDNIRALSPNITVDIYGLCCDQHREYSKDMDEEAAPLQAEE